MAQQLNLFDPRLAPARQHLSARLGGLAMLAVLAASTLGAQGLQWAGQRARLEAQADQAALQPLRLQLGALGPAGAAATAPELARLQALDAEQRRVRAALEAGAAGVREGHADYLVALARRASGRVWITGFSVSEDGQSVVLQGRMTDSTALADYLRQLNAEPRFRGRPFAQLSLNAVDSGGQALPYTEFVLGASGAAMAAAGGGARPEPTGPGAALSLAAATTATPSATPSAGLAPPAATLAARSGATP